jgi:hypothetical protein
MVRRESDPALGLLDSYPTGDELFGNSFGSMHVLDDGTIGYQDGTIQNIHSYYRPAIFYNDTSFKQSNVSPIGSSVWDSIDSNTFWTTPDGMTWIAYGDDYNATNDHILVVKDVVWLRQGSIIPSTTITVAAVFHTKLISNGDWYSRGDDPNDNDWAVRNGTLLAATGDSITGGSEHWGDVFIGFTGNTNGDWVLAGNTDSGDIQTDCVIVLNGSEVVVREGDPVDLDGNGAFDDDAYIGRGLATYSAFLSNDIFLSDDLMLYFFAPLRNGAGDDLSADGFSGDAFLRIDLSADGCPEPGASGNYCTADIDGSGDCLVGLPDLGALLASYGKCPGDPGYNADADLTDDGDPCIKLADLAEMLTQYGDDCNTP